MGSPTVRRITGSKHGTHWRTVTQDLGAVMPRVGLVMEARQGPFVHAKSPVWEDYEEELLGLEGKLGKGVSIVAILSKDHHELATGYPFLYPGADPLVVELEGIDIWDLQAEAYAHLRIGEHRLTAFAADFFVHRPRYLENRIPGVHLGGLAYSARILDGDRAPPEGVHGTVFKRVTEGNEDDYRVIGPLRRVEPSEGLDGPGFLMNIECAPAGSLPVFCLASRLHGLPEVGELADCIVWLQARATDSLFWGNPVVGLFG
jgi:hypothetical protein